MMKLLRTKIGIFNLSNVCRIDVYSCKSRNLHKVYLDFDRNSIHIIDFEDEKDANTFMHILLNRVIEISTGSDTLHVKSAEYLSNLSSICSEIVNYISMGATNV